MNAFSRGANCPACSAPVHPDARFCPQCGASVGDAVRRYQWIMSVPLVHNRFMLYDLAKVLFGTAAVSALLILAILGVSGGERDFLESYLKIMQMFGLILAGFAVATLAGMLVFFGNRYRIGFIMDRHGIRWFTAMARARWLNRAAVVGGFLAGKPSVVGAGLLGQATEKGKIGWGDIRKVKLYPALSVISILNNRRVVVRLYCNPENYPLIVETLKQRATRATFQVLGWAVVVVVPGCLRGGS